ncbi:MAG: YceI family protein [candidate division NC10 bacterium]|nr:YceI family protein [candidate division NC10 bacterium]
MAICGYAGIFSRHRRTGALRGLFLLAVLGFAEVGRACELPPLPEAAKPRATYRLEGAQSLVRFDAKAFMHDFTGNTSKVRGVIRLSDLDRLTDAEGCVTIDAASLETGIATRDGIMRDDHLETAKFPTIDFVLKGVEAVGRQADGWDFTARGTLSLHGVNREIIFPVQARPAEGGVRLAAQVPLKMTDYRIRIPRFLFLAVEDQVLVRFDVTAKRAQ